MAATMTLSRRHGISKCILLLKFLLAFAPQACAICYYPDGSVSPQDTPCSDSTSESTCCGQGYACLSNHICEATGEELKKQDATRFVRGSCTDKSWRSSECPQFCVNPDCDNTAGGNGISKCRNTPQDRYYCINDCMAKFPCKSFADPAPLIFDGQPTPLTTIGVTSTPSSPSRGVTSPDAAHPSPTGSQSSGPNSDAGGSSNHTVYIAVFVTVPVVMIALLAILLFYRRRKRARTAATLELPADGAALENEHKISEMQHPPTELQTDEYHAELDGTRIG